MGWLIACILAVSLFHTRRRLKQLTGRDQFQHVTARSHAQLDPDTAPSSWASASVSAFLYRNLSNLIILRLELGRLLAAKVIERVFYEQAVEQLDALGSVLLSSLGAVPGNEHWRQGREAAWELLVQQQSFPAAPPPWSSVEQAQGQREQDWQQEPKATLQTASPLKVKSPAEPLPITGEPRV